MVVVPELCCEAAPLFIANPGIVSIVTTLATELDGTPCKFGEKDRRHERQRWLKQQAEPQTRRQGVVIFYEVSCQSRTSRSYSEICIMSDRREQCGSLLSSCMYAAGGDR